MTDEAEARQKIDKLIAASGWTVQRYRQLNLSAGRGIALTEVPLRSGACDYLLLANRKPVGIIEAKRQGTTLSTVASQSAMYGSNLPEVFATPDPLPFYYESTGSETFFRDERDPHPRSRRVFAFHRPETLAKWAGEHKTLRRRVIDMGLDRPLATTGMRACQVEAITALEGSLSRDQPRSLVQMATGAGKTYTACAFVYRLIRYAGAKRVLFLVDRSNLGEQAKGEFDHFVTPENGRKFTELYNVQHLTSSRLDDVARVTITTIQRLYSMLRGEEMAEDLDEKSAFELSMADSRPRTVEYNAQIPIETFDFVVVDECHRSIYNLWRQILDYFDAHIIGLTATPSKQTIGFFNSNLVTEYRHERAVVDGVNVGYLVYRIKTDVTQSGGLVEKGFFIDRRRRDTRAIRWEKLDDDLAYTEKELDRSVVVPDQIRTVLRTYRDVLFTELFPGRSMVPKTLIFAKDDSHAEDIVHICREVFGKGNDFCRKVTYRSYNAETKRYEKSEAMIREFRTSPQFRIAVTVDMIATGTDIKPLEALIFLRDVRSQVYFEQMKGRGTRTLTPTDLQAVSGADALAKTHFVIVDAVGVCESDKTDSRPLERKPTVSFGNLLLGVAIGKRDEETLTSVAGRLARLERAVSPTEAASLRELAGGKSLSDLAAALLRATDPDEVEAASRRLAATRQQDLLVQFFNPAAPIEISAANLPHWRQDGVTYFVTFRLADSLPSGKLAALRLEREAWRKHNPEPWSEEQETQYHRRFSGRVDQWLDQGAGSCALQLPDCRAIVTNALRFFDSDRYHLGEFVVAANHVHAVVTPLGPNSLSAILHSWKSFTAKEIAKIPAAAARLEPFWNRPNNGEGPERGSGVPPPEGPEIANERQDAAAISYSARQRAVWQKEYYDHIVRSPEALYRVEAYIRGHGEYVDSEGENQRRDAAATLAATLEAARLELVEEACAPFDRPELRDALADARRDAEQTLDTVTRDRVIEQGFDAMAKEKAEGLNGSFREYIEQNRAEIEALQVLYSRPYAQRLNENMLKELERKLKTEHAEWSEDHLWAAYAAVAPERVTGRSQAGRFADLVSIVRFSLEQQPLLEPFAASVRARFENWLANRAVEGTLFSEEQRSWLELIRDQIAVSVSVEPDDFDYAPFAQQGGLGRASTLFGASLPGLLEELNEALAG